MKNVTEEAARFYKNVILVSIKTYQPQESSKKELVPELLKELRKKKYILCIVGIWF